MTNQRDELRIALEKLKTEFEGCQKSNMLLLDQVNSLTNQLKQRDTELASRSAELNTERKRIGELQQQMDYLKNSNTNLLDRLSDLSVLSKTGAENIKKSLEALSEQSKYIKDLTSAVQRKDSLNLALVMNLKRSLSDVNDEDVTIEVKKGVVYISLSDKMLFKSGSYEITQRAESVLGKIAKILNDYTELEILVEGHTDTVPILTNCMKDNWDLSVLRSTSVVRMLQTKHGVKPARMTAGGRSEYIPKATNASADGRRLNRRTEIVILPQLDQFFKLLEPPRK